MIGIFDTTDLEKEIEDDEEELFKGEIGITNIQRLKEIVNERQRLKGLIKERVEFYENNSDWSMPNKLKEELGIK